MAHDLGDRSGFNGSAADRRRRAALVRLLDGEGEGASTGPPLIGGGETEASREKMHDWVLQRVRR